MESRNRDLLRAENRIEELDEEQENEDNKSVTSSGKSRIGLAHYDIELRSGSSFEKFVSQIKLKSRIKGLCHNINFSFFD